MLGRAHVYAAQIAVCTLAQRGILRYDIGVGRGVRVESSVAILFVSMDSATLNVVLAYMNFIGRRLQLQIQQGVRLVPVPYVDVCVILWSCLGIYTVDAFGS